jgi:hypothetical protein
MFSISENVFDAFYVKKFDEKRVCERRACLTQVVHSLTSNERMVGSFL